MRCFRPSFSSFCSPYRSPASPNQPKSFPLSMATPSPFSTTVSTKKIRLYGIDCPEKDQNHGQQAQHLTSALVAGRTIEVKNANTGSIRTGAGLVQVDGQSLNELLIRDGYAWVHRQTCRETFCSDWVKQKGGARQQKKGMWNDSVVVPPWEWRSA